MANPGPATESKVTADGNKMFRAQELGEIHQQSLGTKSSKG